MTSRSHAASCSLYLPLLTSQLYSTFSFPTLLLPLNSDRLWTGARPASARSRFVYISSTETIGAVDLPPGDEQSPLSPDFAYGETKILAEKVCTQLYVCVGFGFRSILEA